jgi:small nuclear ribonucleoprotein (snRNP)-like protein
MNSHDGSPLLSELIGQVIVVDFRSTYVCLGRLDAFDREFLVLHDADLHDLRDSPATREVYVHDSLRLGIRRNRTRTLIRRDEIIAITRFAEIAEA